MRKIIQVANKGGMICALCDDGSLWGWEGTLMPDGPSVIAIYHWELFPEIPQDDVPFATAPIPENV